MANPYFIDPWAGQSENIAKGLRGLGATLQERRQDKEQQELLGKAQEIFARGDANEIAQFSIANPEIGQRIAGGMKFASDVTRQNMVDSAKEIVTGSDPMEVLQRRLQLVLQEGGDPTETIEAIREYREDPKGVMESARKIWASERGQDFLNYQKAIAGPESKIGTEEGRFNRLLEGLSDKEKELARRIELGLAPRATGSAAQTIAATGATQDVAASEAVINAAKAGASEGAKLKAQYKLRPQVEAAVSEAIAVTKAQADASKESRSNNRALDVYNTGMRAVSGAMDDAYTGPIAGLLPALTAEAQIADGAVAAMAPVLKSMFRTAGEGTFTDKDQELLLAMIPTRKDLPEARAAKLRNIDAIVRAKLAETQVNEESVAPKTVSELTDEELFNAAMGNQ